MTAIPNANPGAEVNVGGAGYSDEVKRSYQETFFAEHSLT